MSQQSWYYAQGQNQVGPIPIEQLQQLWSSGQLTPDTLAWTEGLPNWLPVGSLSVVTGTPSAAPAFDGGTVGYYAANLDVRYAGFWVRFVAFIIDMIVLSIPRVALTLMLGMPTSTVNNRNLGVQPNASLVLVLGIVNFLIQWVYFTLMESSQKQATLGKMAMGIIVTNDRGERIGFGRATGRHFAKILSAITLLIGYIMAGFTEKKQALHDVIASTLVVRKPGR